MAKYRRGGRLGTWGQVLAAVLAALAVFGAVFGIVKLANPEFRKIKPGDFSVGGINDSGAYFETKRSIYTDNFIPCDGLTIEPDFEFEGTYRVFYYNMNKEFLSATSPLRERYFVDNNLACYARIVITPAIPDDTDVDDFKIRTWNVRKYAKQLSIKVLADQNIELPNFMTEEYCTEGKCANFTHATDDGSDFAIFDDETRGYVEISDITDIKQLTFVFRDNQKSDGEAYFFVRDAEGTILGFAHIPIGFETYTLNVPVEFQGEGFSFYFNYKLDNPPVGIYQTK